MIEIPNITWIDKYIDKKYEKKEKNKAETFKKLVQNNKT